MNEKNKVEAVLFALGKDIALEEIARLCSLTPEKTLAILKNLRQEYEQKDSSLTILDKGKFWKFTIKEAYLPLVSNLVTETELDKSTMETLAVVAWKYPVLQSAIIKIRHNKAYEHLKHLQEAGFITKEKHGRTYNLKLTPKFFDYFDLPNQATKQAFKKVIPPEIQEKIKQQEQEIKQKEKEIEEIKQQEQEKKAQNKEPPEPEPNPPEPVPEPDPKPTSETTNSTPEVLEKDDKKK